LQKRTHQIACLGEIVWDDFPDGKRAGGSPGNFIYQAQQLGAEVTFITRVGQDEDGAGLKAYMNSNGIPIDFVQEDPDKATGIVLVHGTPQDPHYTIVEDSAWDNIEFETSFLAPLKEASAFCFATLVQRSRKSKESLKECLSVLNEDCLRVLDVNLRQPFYNKEIVGESIRQANLVKMNEEELVVVGTLLEKPNLVDWMLNDMGVTYVCTTLGESGSELRTKDGIWTQQAFVNPNSGGDTIGVGDAFLASLTIALLDKAPIQEALFDSSKHAAKVAEIVGATI